jgi:hypothetical protein
MVALGQGPSGTRTMLFPDTGKALETKMAFGTHHQLPINGIFKSVLEHQCMRQPAGSCHPNPCRTLHQDLWLQSTLDLIPGYIQALDVTVMKM